MHSYLLRSTRSCVYMCPDFRVGVSYYGFVDCNFVVFYFKKKLCGVINATRINSASLYLSEH